MTKPIRRVQRVSLGILALFACGSVAADAVAGDKKAYHATFCVGSSLNDDFSYRAQGLYFFERATAACPVIRDQTADDLLPRVLVEGYQESNTDEPMSCMVVWMNEDSSTGEFRGYSEEVDSTATGKVQFAFDDSDYDLGFAGLSPGGEGSIVIMCYVQEYDVLYQYYVDENRF